MTNKLNKLIDSIKYRFSFALLLLFSWLLGFFVFSLLSHNQPMSNISLDNPIQTNLIQVNEKLFFPLGFYHVSSQAQKIDALPDLAAAGFNTIHASCRDLNEYNTFLDEAYRLGIYVITEFKGTEPLEVVAKFKDKPAVLGWSLADDAGDHESSYQIRELHKKVKLIDPQHFTYISVSSWSKKWDDYADVADLIGGQSYPIGYPFNNRPKGLANDISEVNYVFNIGRAAADKYNHPVIANLQTFRWKKGRWPTSEEVYNMTYQALLAGVKGILFYTYQDSENYIKEKSDVWNQVKSIVPEIQKINPVLQKGILTKIDTKVNDLLAGQWKLKNDIYLVLINTSFTETKQASITVPASAKGPAKPLFPNRPSGMVFENGKLIGLIKPGDVHVYQLSKNKEQ